MSGARCLLLIKHSLPEPIPGLNARDWHLSDEGRRRSRALADRIAPYAPTVIVSSREPKARETADLVGRALGLPVTSLPGLHEHDRTGVPWLGQDEFETAVRTFFDHPDELVFGRETAGDAGARFSEAVEAALGRYPTGAIAIVAHGTVISGYIVGKTGVDPFNLWQRLNMPSFVVLALPDLRLVEIVEGV